MTNSQLNLPYETDNRKVRKALKAPPSSSEETVRKVGPLPHRISSTDAAYCYI